MKKIFLYLMNKKGLICLERIVAKFDTNIISGVKIDRDAATLCDYSKDIEALCIKEKIPFCYRSSSSLEPATDVLKIAVGWRRLISDYENLIIFHDSLLPRLRGFNPLVTAMLNKDPMSGVTALWASRYPDQGPIIGQKSFTLEYPSNIKENINKVSMLYADLLEEIITRLREEESLPCAIQSEKDASYSLWRDDDDYQIDWNKSAEEIIHQINCLGFPYLGAKCYVEQKKIRILSAFLTPDKAIENRTPGKIFDITEQGPIVVCGSGLICLTEMKNETGGDFSVKHFRTRFR